MSHHVTSLIPDSWPSLGMGTPSLISAPLLTNWKSGLFVMTNEKALKGSFLDPLQIVSSSHAPQLSAFFRNSHSFSPSITPAASFLLVFSFEAIKLTLKVVMLLGWWGNWTANDYTKPTVISHFSISDVAPRVLARDNARLGDGAGPVQRPEVLRVLGAWRPRLPRPRPWPHEVPGNIRRSARLVNLQTGGKTIYVHHTFKPSEWLNARMTWLHWWEDIY